MNLYALTILGWWTLYNGPSVTDGADADPTLILKPSCPLGFPLAMSLHQTPRPPLCLLAVHQSCSL
jgi:hypothetical protein